MRDWDVQYALQLTPSMLIAIASWARNARHGDCKEWTIDGTIFRATRGKRYVHLEKR